MRFSMVANYIPMSKGSKTCRRPQLDPISSGIRSDYIQKFQNNRFFCKFSLTYIYICVCVFERKSKGTPLGRCFLVEVKPEQGSMCVFWTRQAGMAGWGEKSLKMKMNTI